MNVVPRDILPDIVREPRIRQVTLAFRQRGWEIYLVGGAVRDRLLGVDSKELDFATSALPPVTAGILGDLALGSLYRLGEKFGTIGLVAGDLTIEVTTYRSEESYEPGSRKPVVRFGSSLEQDLMRRDFTINAMACDPVTGELIDPLGGFRDLQAHLVRAVGSAPDRFEEDPLRLLRAVRFAARLRFDVAPDTWDAMRAGGAALETVSRERIRDEYTRMLLDHEVANGLTLLRDAGLFQHSVPVLSQLTRMQDHGPRHPLSLWDHTMRVVSGVRPSLALRWAAVLHDIAKPETRTHEPSGRPRFFHHEARGADIARDTLGGLRYPGHLVEDVVLLIQTHMQVHAYSPEWTDGAVRRLMLRLGPLLPDAILLARADAAGHSGPAAAPQNAPKFDDLERRVLALEREPIETLKSPLTGDELMERFHRAPGPWIGRIKAALEEEVIEGRLRPGDRERAWRIAEQMTGHDT